MQGDKLGQGVKIGQKTKLRSNPGPWRVIFRDNLFVLAQSKGDQKMRMVWKKISEQKMFWGRPCFVDAFDIE